MEIQLDLEIYLSWFSDISNYFSYIFYFSYLYFWLNSGDIKMGNISSYTIDIRKCATKNLNRLQVILYYNSYS